MKQELTREQRAMRRSRYLMKHKRCIGCATKIKDGWGFYTCPDCLRLTAEAELRAQKMMAEEGVTI